ncbi:MAG: DNA-directed RNA polymerase subunit beta', partial [Alphaproteobacteria bacterium]
FEPVLIEGKAIQLHPLVCAAYNADFDGDQMAVHVPLSIEAQVEARALMMSTNNILSPASGKPIIVPTQDMVLGLYWMTRERPGVLGSGRRFAGSDEVRAAFDHGEIALQAAIEVRLDAKMVKTTVGRILLSEIVPAEIPFEAVNKVMKKKELAELIDRAYRKAGNKATVIFADRLKDMGFAFATRAGISIGIKDMRIPGAKHEFIEEANKEVAEIAKQYANGLITEGERYNKVIDIWADKTDRIADAMMRELRTEQVLGLDGRTYDTDSFNPVFMMSDSGARGSAQQIRQLAGMRGLMAKPSGAIIETPITANFREGLTVLQYFISTHGARKGLADTALKTANSGYLTRRMVDVAQDSIITQEDCETLDGIDMTPLVEGGEIIESLGDRVLGRVALEDIVDPVDGRVLVAANEEIDEEKVALVEDANVDHVKIRSVLTCRAEHGVCCRCYGRDLARGAIVHIGEAIGVIASQSIGEPGTQLTMRTFHIGGTASRRVEQAELFALHDGVVRIESPFVTGADGNLIVMGRNGKLSVEYVESVKGADGGKKDVVRKEGPYNLVYGAKLRVRDGQSVKAGKDLLAEWDPYTTPLLTEVAGNVKFGDLIDAVTIEDRLDERTGLSNRVVIDPAAAIGAVAEPARPKKGRGAEKESATSQLTPRISIKDGEGRTLRTPSGPEARYALPVGIHVQVVDGQAVQAGDVLAKMPRETTKTKDITGGLPRVAELFEARKPKESATVSEIDGVVSFGKDTKGKRKIEVTPEIGEKREYLIPKGKHIRVHPGDHVRAGDPLMDGATNPHDILTIKGEKELAKFLVDEIQEIYRLQGVRINDKHIEVIVRQMLRRLTVVSAGDTDFLVGEPVEKPMFDRANRAVAAAGGEEAKATPLLLGITKASLSTASFISAASFQETTKVLTDAAVHGKTDYLSGLKENVIMGRLIPAGTGLHSYAKLDVHVNAPEGGDLLEEGAAPPSGDVSAEVA